MLLLVLQNYKTTVFFKEVFMSYGSRKSKFTQATKLNFKAVRPFISLTIFIPTVLVCLKTQQ